MGKIEIAILGAGIFVRTQYIPRLAEISNLFTLKAIWSRTEVLFYTHNFQQVTIFFNFAFLFCNAIISLSSVIIKDLVD